MISLCIQKLWKAFHLCATISDYVLCFYEGEITMGHFRDRLISFMYGRYGIDQLYYALTILAFILIGVNSFLHSPVLSIITCAVLIITIYRAFSRKTYRRYKENEKFMQVWNWIKRKTLFQIRRIKEIRTHRYHRCPHCKAMLRLPYRRGKHTVQCPRCNKEFKIRVII